MAQHETLFQLLARQPWWVTGLVAFALFWIAYAFFPPIAPFVALPFALLAIYFAYKQWKTGAPSDLPQRLAEIRALNWETFSRAVVDAYRSRGYIVTPSEGSGYDFKLTRDGYTTLVQCRRWKVNQVGEAPIRELVQAITRDDASRGICLAAGEFTAPARKIAADEPVTLVSGAALVELVDVTPKRRWWKRR